MTAEIILFPRQRLSTTHLSMGNLVLFMRQDKHWQRLNNNEKNIVLTAEQLVMSGKDWDQPGFYRILIKVHYRLMGDTLINRINVNST